MGNPRNLVRVNRKKRKKKGILGAIIGSIAGFFLSGGSSLFASFSAKGLGAAAGGALQGGMLGFNLGAGLAKGPFDLIEGPEIDAVNIQGTDYNAGLNRAFGRSRLAGNLIWIKGNQIYSKESNRTYGEAIATYNVPYATFAITLSAGPLAYISHIYAEGTLIYKGSTITPSEVKASEQGKRGRIFFHMAGSNNEQNLLMAEDLSADYPAFRGTSYVVFEDFELEDYGNRIPDFEFVVADIEEYRKSSIYEDVVSTDEGVQKAIVVTETGVTGYPTSTVFPETGTDVGWTWTNNTFYKIKYNALSYKSLTNMPKIAKISVSADDHTSISSEALIRIEDSYQRSGITIQVFPDGLKDNDGANLRLHWPLIFYIDSSDRPRLGLLETKWHTVISPWFLVEHLGAIDGDPSFSLSTIPVQCTFYSPRFEKVTRAFVTGSGGVYYYNSTAKEAISGDLRDYRYSSYQINTRDYIGIGATTTWWVNGEKQDKQVSTVYAFTATTLYELEPDFLTEVASFALPVNAAPGQCALTSDRTHIVYKKASDNKVVVVSLETSPPSVIYTSTVTFPGQIEIGTDGFGLNSIFNIYNRDLADSIGDESTNHLSLRVGEPVFGEDSSDPLVIAGYKYDPDPIDVREVVQAILEENPYLSYEDIDASGVNRDTVVGYTVSDISSAASVLKPVIQANLLDVYEEDYKIKIRNRSNASIVETITVDDLQAHEQGEEVPDEVVHTIAAEDEAPGRVHVEYISKGQNYDRSVQYAGRLNTESQAIEELSIPMILTPNSAAQLAQNLLAIRFLEVSGTIQLRTNFKYSHLEVASLITVETSDNSYGIRISKIDKGKPGIVEIEGTFYDSSSLSSPNVGSEGDEISTILSPISDSIALPFDTAPLWEDQDDYGYYLGIWQLEPTYRWFGAMVSVSLDTQVWQNHLSFQRQMTFGHATDVLTDTGVIGTWDESETLNVRTVVGSFTSALEASVRLGQENYLVYGEEERWEIMKFLNATLEADGTYTLDTLIRGYYGTESYMGSHQENDIVYLVDRDTVKRSFIKEGDRYNTWTFYSTRSAGEAQNDKKGKYSQRKTNPLWVYSKAEGKTPRPPVHIRASREIANDLYWASVVTYLRANSDYTDETGRHSWNAFGAVIDNTVYKFGGGSSKGFGGAYRGMSGFPPSADWAFSTGDFTVEAWIYVDLSTVVAGFDGLLGNLVSGAGWGLEVDDSGNLRWISNTTNLITSGSEITTNTWHHVAVSRVSGTSRIFVDGILINSGADTQDLSATRSLTIHKNGGNSRVCDAYIDEFRVTKGVGRYTTDFFPNNADPHWESVTELIHFDDPNNRYDIARAENWTDLGSATFSSDIFKFGGKSLQLPELGRLTTTSNTAFGTGDFTIEMWVYVTEEKGATQEFATIGGIELKRGSDGSFQTTISTPASSLLVGQWHHIAVCRASNVQRLFVDGVLGASTSDSVDRTFSSGHVLGTATVARKFEGYIDDVRVTVGVGRYTATFSPPTQAYLDFGSEFPTVTSSNTEGDITIRWMSQELTGRNWSEVNWELTTDTRNFEVDIMDGATVVRTLTASGTSGPYTALYSAANQMTDFGYLKRQLTANIYEIDNVTGRGLVGTGVNI